MVLSKDGFSKGWSEARAREAVRSIRVPGNLPIR